MAETSAARPGGRRLLRLDMECLRSSDMTLKKQVCRTVGGEDVDYKRGKCSVLAKFLKRFCSVPPDGCKCVRRAFWCPTLALNSIRRVHAYLACSHYLNF